ncbi:MAG: hypothetical protein C0505_05480 [Leptothrix sp. (in: Bacteria)]|nr:hypothetical protein [Leptothrix sp. (in: b-proteobacteria)]
MKPARLLMSVLLASGMAAAAWAKLPPPSDEAKAKAAEAAAKTAHAGKMAAYELCKSMDATAARYYADAKKAGKQTNPPVATPPCTNPGPFVYAPAAPAAAAAPAPAVAAAPKK